jgi:hypothetical protein
MEESELSNEVPTAEEKRILDEAWAEYEKTGDAGIPWREAIREVLEKRKS